MAIFPVFVRLTGAIERQAAHSNRFLSSLAANQVQPHRKSLLPTSLENGDRSWSKIIAAKTFHRHCGAPALPPTIGQMPSPLISHISINLGDLPLLPSSEKVAAIADNATIAPLENMGPSSPFTQPGLKPVQRAPPATRCNKKYACHPVQSSIYATLNQPKVVWFRL